MAFGFDQLPSKLATLWGSRTIARRRLGLEIEVEEFFYTDGGQTGGTLAPSDRAFELQDGEDVRQRAACMEKKRLLLNKYNNSDSAKSKRLQVSTFPIISKKYFKNLYSSVLSRINIIEKYLKKIEGKFGFTVLSYFHFILWLFLSNVFLSLFILLFLVLPQIALSPTDFRDFCPGGSLAENSYSEINNFTEEACNLTRGYYRDVIRSTNNENLLIPSKQGFLDFLQGTGWMEGTIMFYGSYFTKTIPSYYNMALAFILTTGFYFLTFLVIIVAYSASSIKQRMLTYKKLSNLSPSHIPTLPLAEKLFCGWDFAITDGNQAAYRHTNIFKTIQEACREIQHRRNKKPPTIKEIVQLWLIRIFINILVLFLIVLSMAGIVASIVTQPKLLLNDSVKNSGSLKLLISFIPPTSVVFFNFVMPYVFGVLITYEKYSPETQLNLTLLRSVLINLTSILTLVITIGTQLICGKKQPCITTVPCWETYVGQQLYKLSLIDFVVDIVSTFLEFVRRKLVDRFQEKKFIKWLGYQSFDVPKNIIDVVYKQSICWLGIFVAPMISVITALKFLVLFALKTFTALINCKPSGSEQKTFESRYFFAVLLLLTLFFCSSLNAFAVGRILPSQSCGPFRIFTKDNHYIYTAMTDNIATFSSSMQTFIWFLETWMFFIILTILLSLFMLYYLSLVAGNKKLAKNLEDQLISMKSDNQQYRKEILALKQRLNRQKNM